MINDSDTESEPDSSLPKCSASDFAAAYGVRDSQESIDANSAQNAETAIETLKSLDLAIIQSDTSFHGIIQNACDDILHFLDDILSSAADRNVPKDLITLVDMLRPSFLSTLFQYRQIFHRIASRAVVPGAAAPTIICWVDVLLVKLGDATTFVAGGFSSEESERSCLLPTLKIQREDGKLVAAAQLPHQWKSVPEVVANKDASPAAKRLSLRLTFASYIVAPQLHSCDPWNDGGITPAEMNRILHTYIQRLSVSRGPHSVTTDGQADLFENERIAYAMVISLFAGTGLTKAEDTDSITSPPFRPHTLTSLLSLICFIIHPHTATTTLDYTCPIEPLDPAQTILIRWGHTVPFCWIVWDDQKIAHTKSIAHLTTTWLYHLKMDLSAKPCEDENFGGWKENLTSYIVKEPTATNSALLVLLANLPNLSSQQEYLQDSPLSNVLFKSCWALTQLVNPAVIDGWKTPLAERTCELLCNIFVLVGISADGLKIKDLLIEALTFLDPKALSSALDRLQKDTRVHFVVKLEDIITRAKRKFLDVNRTSLTECDLLTTKHILNFLTIVWRSGTEGGVHHHTLSCFLTPLVNWLSNQSQESCIPTHILLDSLLTALAALEGLRSGPISTDINKFRLWDDESIWQLAIYSPRCDLIVATAFANLILATPECRLCDALSCAEAWDYLRDVAFLALTHQFLGDDEPLALIVSPVICGALLFLLQRVDLRIAQSIISSPWTKNLCADLQGLSSSNDEYSSILATRILPIGNILLNEVSHKSHPHAEGGSPAGRPASESRLIFIRMHSIPRLMLVPGSSTS